MAATDETLTCTACGCTSAWKAAFRPVMDGTRTRMCCPHCVTQLKRKRRALALAGLLLASVFWLAMLSRGHLRQFDAIGRISILTCWTLLWAQVLVIPHEWGHALCARLAGASAYAIQIGEWPWLLDRRLGGVRWRIGRVWSGGMTWHEPCEGPGARLRSVFITMGGPLMNLLIAVAAFAAVPRGKGLSSGAGAMLLLSLGTASLLQFLVNLWPRRIQTPIGQIQSDGASILRRLRGQDDDPRVQRALMHDYRARLAFEDRHFATAAREAAFSQELWAQQIMRWSMMVTRAAALAESDDAAGAVKLLLPLVEMPGLDPSVRVGVLDNLAWAYLLLDDPAQRERALELVEEACILAPWERAILITKGCLLAVSANPENGRIEAARNLLSRLDVEELSAQCTAYAALARGLIAAAQGDAAARVEYDNAKSLHATAAPLRVLERRLPSR